MRVNSGGRTSFKALDKLKRNKITTKMFADLLPVIIVGIKPARLKVIRGNKAISQNMDFFSSIWIFFEHIVLSITNNQLQQIL